MHWQSNVHVLAGQNITACVVASAVKEFSVVAVDVH
jgi:hypothetical protein